MASVVPRFNELTSDVHLNSATRDTESSYLRGAIFDDVFVYSRTKDGLSATESHNRYLDVVLKTQGYINLQYCVMGSPRYMYWAASWARMVYEQTLSRYRQ